MSQTAPKTPGSAPPTRPTCDTHHHRRAKRPEAVCLPALSLYGLEGPGPLGGLVGSRLDTGVGAGGESGDANVRPHDSLTVPALLLAVRSHVQRTVNARKASTRMLRQTATQRLIPYSSCRQEISRAAVAPLLRGGGLALPSWLRQLRLVPLALAVGTSAN
jgi:hypothetical protein